MSDYVVNIRRKLHMYPEVGFDLPRTLELIRTELDSMGVPYTEEFGKSSIVATLNDEKKNFTIGIRADIDALPIAEKTNVPYKSKIKGQMHACGHDAHTAILLDTVRKLSAIKDEINCRVKFLFQAAEEYPPSGAKLMLEDGVMDDIDCIVALHTETKYDVGRAHIMEGAQNAISNGFFLEFDGKSAHAALQEAGIDAIAMAIKAYTAIEFMIAKEFSAKTVRIFNVGAFNAGKTNNVICKHASLYCTLRTWDEETNDKAVRRIKEIIAAVAKESGGRAKFVPDKFYPIVYNHPVMTAKMREAIVDIVGEDKVGSHVRAMGGEDFAYLANVKPGCMFRLGVRNPEKDCIYSAHQDKHNIDEDCLDIGSDIFVRFVKNNMSGINL